MLSLWQRIPIAVRAVVCGIVILYAGGIPWGGIAGIPFLAEWNLRVFVKVPWAVLPMGLYLWLFWKYIGGGGWPRSTAESRRMSLRANSLPGEAWGLALIAGFLGLTATLPLLGIMGRLFHLPEEAQPNNIPAAMPSVTVFILVVMASLVAGVVEEAAMRGYMQGPIERRHGPVLAILISGTVFGLAHYTHHPASVLEMLPYYIFISAVYGGMAYATNSILPSLALHAGGDIFSLSRLVITQKPEWQIGATPPGLIWDTGVDLAFLGSVVMFLLISAGAFWAMIQTRKLMRE